MDGPDFNEWDEPKSDDTMACPSCRQPVYDDAEQCPHCGMYITEEENSGEKPLWIVVGALLCLGVVIYFWVLP